MIRVAIIEDDPVMRDLLSGAVEACDDMMVTSTADNVAMASGMIEAGGYDVLLCDLGLPDGSGITLIRQEALTGRDTDILVITIFANQNKVLDAIRAGARGYLLKDERIEDCIEAIRNIRRGGSPISPIIARQLLGQITPEASQPSAPLASPLSEREYEVLNLLSRGFSNSECADILTVSANTIGTHVKNIYRKLEVNSRAEALFEASSQGLLARQ
ncbi:response regulator [Sphingorhabdus sp.]|jgi:DNA-binding NarL/FixJ family response regulator|uniref:response regulator n=2 Tax=Sphingorhabdus sp. TaxID=1902408 RepID=UPI003BAE4AC9|nr:response regulator transcription factor [Sphingomonadales bacterium]MBK9431165.1 response regulator transcription factor [Sphingomonadales bacterium]MBL0021301.1 response regulator transcription factor [Sphingomonadales bacterium]